MPCEAPVTIAVFCVCAISSWQCKSLFSPLRNSLSHNFTVQLASKKGNEVNAVFFTGKCFIFTGTPTSVYRHLSAKGWLRFERLVWCGDIGETKHSLPIETYSKHQQNVSIRSSNRNFSGLEKRKVYSRYTDFSTRMVLFARKVRRIGKSAKAAT